jgi:hypothetical protein
MIRVTKPVLVPDDGYLKLGVDSPAGAESETKSFIKPPRTQPRSGSVIESWH